MTNASWRWNYLWIGRAYWVVENELGTKYLCPPFDTQTTTVILRNNGEGYYLRYENGI